MKIKTPPKIKIKECPYRASNNGSCSHKGTSSRRREKRYCSYGDPHNCEFFLEWIEISSNAKKSKSTPINPQKNTIGDNI